MTAIGTDFPKSVGARVLIGASGVDITSAVSSAIEIKRSAGTIIPSASFSVASAKLP